VPPLFDGQITELDTAPEVSILMNSGSNNIKGYALREPVSNKVSIQMTSYQSTAPTTPLEMKKNSPMPVNEHY